MYKLKKLLKLLGFIVIIALASAGIGINAAVIPQYRRQDPPHTIIEMVDEKDEDDEKGELKDLM